ncbi:MAG: response regulator transcription factor [Anaerolineae bacterium]|jgi:DNA-binding NarL/FixJ family response regulator|nr:response regulator transcription factor [Anaerolineae bacterium]
MNDAIHDTAKIRLLLVDDQDVVRVGIGAIISMDEHIEVAGTAADGQEAVYMVEQLQPDLVLMDLKMPIMNGILATRLIKEQFPQTKVLVLTTYDADEWVFDAIRAGAEGYLLKDSSREELLKAIMDTMAGKTAVDPNVAGKLFQHVQQNITPSDSKLTENLSERELEILKLIASGLNNRAIAESLFLSEGTVRNYVSSILAKLEVEDRTQAAIIALRYGLKIN